MPRSSAQRRATQNSPSSLASVQPIGARVPAAVQALEGRDQRHGGGVGLAADRRGRVQQAGEFDRAQRVRELGADRGREVLDVRDLDDRRLVGRGDPDGVGAQGAGDAADDDRLLLAVLVGAQELLAEVVVDGGVGGAAGGAGQRDGLGALARRGGSAARARRRRTPRRRGRRRRRNRTRSPRAGRRRPRRRRAASGAWTVTSRARTIFSKRAGADALDGARDGGLVVLGRGDGVDAEAARRAPGRASAAGRGAAPPRRRGERAQRAPPGRRPARRAPRTSAGRRRRGGPAPPRGRSDRRRRSRPSAAPCRRPGRTRTRRPRRARRPGGPSGASATARRASSRHAAATLLEAVRPGRASAARRTPSAASAEPPRSGCSKQNQSSPAAREAKTTALGIDVGADARR